MNKEKDFIVLVSLVAVGIIIASGLAMLIQRWVVFPVTLFGIVMFPLALLQNKEKFTHITENLENIVFIVTLFIIAISFIVLYKPM
jgi:energy-converting hydrogenase A subunit K